MRFVLQVLLLWPLVRSLTMERKFSATVGLVYALAFMVLVLTQFSVQLATSTRGCLLQSAAHSASDKQFQL